MKQPVYGENLPPVSIALLPTGVRILSPATPGRSYTIQRALAVTGPWSTLATLAAPILGIIEHTTLTRPRTAPSTALANPQIEPERLRQHSGVKILCPFSWNFPV